MAEPESFPLRRTFRTTRGGFVIPAAYFDEGREHDLARCYAQGMPLGAKAAGRMVRPDGSVEQRWRRIVIVNLA